MLINLVSQSSRKGQNYHLNVMEKKLKKQAVSTILELFKILNPS